MKLKAVEFTGVILLALVTGVFWGTWFTLTRSIEAFTSECFLAIGKTIIRNVAVPMSILIPFTLLILLLVCLLSWNQARKSFYFYLISFLLMIITLIITVGVEVPIDNQIKTWTADNLPANWEFLRNKWDRFHTLRTFTSIGSFCFFAGGMVKRMLRT